MTSALCTGIPQKESISDSQFKLVAETGLARRGDRSPCTLLVRGWPNDRVWALAGVEAWRFRQENLRAIATARVAAAVAPLHQRWWQLHNPENELGERSADQPSELFKVTPRFVTPSPGR